VRTIAIALFTLAGCIDEFQGSNIQIDFGEFTPVQASAYGTVHAEELPSNIHFTLYAMDETMDSAGNTVGHLFEIQQFEIHRVVDLDSPCYIDAGPRVPIPGLHMSQFAAEIGKLKGIDDIANPPASASEDDKIDVATAMQRQQNIASLAGHEGPKAITSASPRVYRAVAASCDDTNGIPPPHCTDAASNQRRLEMCRAAWATDEQMFEGTDRILTQPLNGSVAGFVLGMHPVNLAPIGGAGFFVDEVLDRFEGYALYWQYDDADNDGQPDYPPSVPQSERSKLGELYLFGRPETNITRGVIHVHMSSFVHTDVHADLVIFAAIGDDDVHF
jgi:hypothetical protein